LEKRGKKISLNQILAEVELTDVKAFLTSYAKQDKSFDVAMKAHFVSRVVTSDPDSKYLNILNQVIKPRTLANDKVGPTLKKTIKIIFQDFLYQTDDLLSTENYTETFYIVKNSLDKIAYLQNKYLIQDKAIEKFRLEFLNNLEVILEQNLAPTFRKKVESLLLENIRKSYFLPKQKNLIVLLDDHSVLTESDKRMVITDLLQKVNNRFNNLEVINTMLQIAVPIGAVAKILIKEIPHDKIFHCLVEMISNRKYDIVNFYISNENLGYSLYSEVLNAMILHEKEEYPELTLSLRRIDPESTPNVILKELIRVLSLHYLNAEFSNLKNWIERLPFGQKCELLNRAEKFDVLLELLRDKQDIDWLKVYDQKLIDLGYEQKVENLYSDLALNHLNEHLGETANNFILKILNRLKVISQKDMLENIQNKLYEQYSHRKSLL